MIAELVKILIIDKNSISDQLKIFGGFCQIYIYKSFDLFEFTSGYNLLIKCLTLNYMHIILSI